MSVPIFAKVKAGFQTGSLVTLIATAIVWGLGRSGLEIPMETAVVVAGFAVTVVSFFAGWSKKETVRY